MVRPPRGSTRSVKYIVDIAGASEAAGFQAHTIALGTDNATLGQTGPTDVAVPTGSKIVLLDIRMPKVNLGAGTANFIHWALERTLAGQSLVNPSLMGGHSNRTSVLLSGVIGLGAGQNNSLHIRYKVPKKFQRVSEGLVWTIAFNNGLACSAIYQFMYKVFQ